MSTKRCIIRPNGIEDFCFLSKTAFLVAEQMGAFEVFTFTDPADPSAYPRPTLRSTFLLPKLKPTQLFWYLTINCNPSSGSVPLFPPQNSQLSPFPRTIRDYHLKPEERILGCAIGTVNPENHQGDGAPHTFDCFIFFIHAKVFMDSIDENRVSGFHLISSPPASQTPGPLSNSTDSAQNDGVVKPEDPLLWVDQILNALGDDDFSTQPKTRTRAETPTAGTSTWKTVGRYEWDEWGPQNTRWFQDMLSTNWQHAIHGLRTVECVLDGERNGDPHIHGHQHLEHTTRERKLRVRDFNPNIIEAAIVAKRDEKKDEGKNKWKVVTTKDPVTGAENVFEEEIWSALPYREVVTEETVQVAEVMMDESRILLIKVRDSDTG